MPLLLESEPHLFRSRYAWSAETGGPGLTVRYFRNFLNLDTVPDSFVVRLTADSRYVFSVNGQRVGRGPEKGTLDHYFYETYDIATTLRSGLNILGVEVRFFGWNAPTSEVHSNIPAFLFEGPEGADLDTPGDWKVYIDAAVRPDTKAYIGNAQNFLNHLDIIDARKLPLGWLEPGYDDSEWEETITVNGVTGNPDCGVFPVWNLQPRDIPLLVEEPKPFTAIVENQCTEPIPASLDPLDWSIGVNGHILVLSAGHLTTGYPVFHFSGGKGRTVRITYAEAMGFRETDARGNRHWVKRQRDDTENGEPHGYQDTLILPGGDFTWEPFHWRTFWFIRIEVEPGDNPLTLHAADYRFTTFDQDFTAVFRSEDPDTERFMDLSVRTLQLCAHETYEDCPYYEQLNYVADTRLQILCSYALANNTHLARRAIRSYRDSLRKDGLTEARCPSREKQIIPYFSLIWILMVDDYWRQCGTPENDFVSSCLLAVDGILWFFRRRLEANGMIGKVPKWNMVDRGPGWIGGEPPALREGNSTYLTGLYVYALDAAVRLHRQTGIPGDADRWEPLAEELRAGLRENTWSDKEGLFLEGVGIETPPFSQHVQSIAILADIATADQTRRILDRLTSDDALVDMKFMQSFYLARALEKAGAYAPFWSTHLDKWRFMMKNGVSTWQEYPDPTRSDCHAWTSWIAYDFVSTVLGIKVDAVSQILTLAPRTEGIGWANGAAPTPFGRVSVDWKKDGEGRLIFTADAPTGTHTRLILPGGESREITNGGKIQA